MVRDRLKHEPTWYLKKLYYDGVGYHAPALKLARELIGAERIMFGYNSRKSQGVDIELTIPFSRH